MEEIRNKNPEDIISEEEGKAMLQVDMAYLSIEKAKTAYNNLFKNRSDIDKLLDKETGFQEKKAAQLMRIMKFYLPIIIDGKKKLNIDWGHDNMILEKITKVFANENKTPISKG